MIRHVPPIPKELLIHTVTYHEYDPTPYGEGFKEPITLNFVRVDPNHSIKQGSTSDTIISNSLLFFDTVNSEAVDSLNKPIDFTFKKESKIVFKGEEMIVDEVDDLYAYDPDTPHHYEVILI